MRRALIVIIGAASFAGPPSAAAERVLVQHVAADARASVLRYDPRYAGNGPTEEIAPARAETSTVGLHGRDAVSRGWAAQHGVSQGANDPFGSGAVAEQRAGADNAAPVTVAGPLGGEADAHARAIDLATGVCPPADADGIRTLSTAGVSGQRIDLGGIRAALAESRATTALLGPMVVSDASVEIASVTLGDAFELRVAGESRLALSASGLPGGITVDYQAPIVDVIDLSTGERIARLDADDPGVELTSDGPSFLGFSPILNVRLGVPHDIIVMDDGRYARAQLDVIEVRAFDPGGSFEWQHLRIGSLAASVNAPAGGVQTCDGGQAPAVDLSVPRVLVYERTSGWEHTSIKQAALEFAIIANAAGTYTVEYTTDPSFLRPDKLAGIDAVYFNSTTGNFPWSAAQKTLFTDWLTCDGGVIGTHAASDANHSGWPEWEEIIGASFASHPHVGYFPVIGEATVQVEDQSSPITEGWHGQPTFRWAEEYYQFETNPRGRQDVHVLLSLDETSTYPTVSFLPSPFGGGYVDDQPLAWTKTFRGDGRVFYTAFGHNGFAWAHPEFRTHIQHGTEWVTAKRPEPGCLAG